MPVVDNNSQRILTPNYLYQGRLWTVISNYQIRKDIMDSIFIVLREFFERRSKLTAIRIELHLKQWTANNAPVREFFTKLRRQLFKKYGKIYHRYIWVREQVQATAQHYHAVLLVDGQFVKHPSIIKKIASSIWSYGYLCLPPRPFYHIHRDQIGRFCALVYRLSYLAKAETKGNRPKKVRDYGFDATGGIYSRSEAM
ncbi:YagK/YfjJ domain-containing protein [Aeromonas caviae]|uniref:YagK/YfjJ domain-containing protein n=1 Tax=Aeromonas caviae TaxID=648 RepID=UPI002B46049D|nr:inovirus-type Gp2 protein [Aeromonas caviae]